MQFLTFISRLLVGLLFIVSGLIKANDALGFSYKLEEYFSSGVLNMEFLIPFSFLLAAGICIAEIVLGVMVLIGARPKFTSWSLLGMIVFFTFLTFYSAYFNKVTDCGCFGDAVKLTPWESFGKDIVLLFFITVIFLKKNVVKPLLSFRMENILLVVITFFCFTLVYHTYNHLPIKDFRPYAVGKSIPEGMKSCDELGLPCPEKIDYFLVKNKETGEEKVVLSSEWNWQTDDFISNTEKWIEIEGYEPPVKDFTISIDGADYTDSILNSDYAILLVAYDLSKTANHSWSRVNDLAAGAEEMMIPFITLSASSDELIDEFRHDVQAAYPFYFTDETTLKTIVRSNPGLLLLKKGTIIGKWHYNDFPTFEEIKQILL
tara:strand:- start:3292 stop:4416 length:1125 start_codon:yes stop_codon:yes gene_type:complete